MANAAITATASTAAKIAKVICVRRRLLQLRSLFMGNTFSNLNQRNSLEPVPPSAGVETGSLPRIGRPEADHGMGDHAAAYIGGWAISGLMTLATILLLRHFQI